MQNVRGAVPGAPVNLRTLSRLLEYALALPAWKQAGGTRWALRVNRSSGNLHPTGGRVLIGGSAALGEAPGLLSRSIRISPLGTIEISPSPNGGGAGGRWSSRNAGGGRLIQAEWMQFVQYAPERGGPGSLPIKVALMSRAGADYRHGSIPPGVASLNGADAKWNWPDMRRWGCSNARRRARQDCPGRVRGVALHPWAISWKSSLRHGA